MPDDNDNFAIIPNSALVQLAQHRQLAQKLDTPEGKNEIADELKKLDYYQVAANQGQDRDPKTLGTIEKLLSTGDIKGLSALLGSEQAMQMAREYVDAANKFEADRDSARSTGRAVTDTVIGIGAGLLKSALGIGAATAGAAGADKTADHFVRALKSFGEDADSVTSDPLLAHKRVEAARTAGAEAEHLAQQKASEDANPETRGDFTQVISDFGARIVKDAASGAYNTVTDPMLLVGGTADAAASMAMAAGTGKLLSIAGQGAAKQMAKTAAGDALVKALTKSVVGKPLGLAGKALGMESNQSFRVEALDQLGFMGSNAVQEGGNAFTQTFQQIMDADPKDLLKSKDFQEFTKGMSEEQILEAKTQFANKMAWEASWKTGVVAAGISELIGKQGISPTQLLKHPTTGRGVIGQVGKESITEGIEEGAQSGTGAFVANEAIRKSINPDQDMAAGVGAQAGQGAILGAISTGALKSHNVLQGAGMEASSGARALGEKISQSGAKADAALEAESVVALGGLNQQAQGLKKIYDAPDTQTALKATLEQIAKTSSPEASKDSLEALSELTQAAVVSETPKSFEKLSPEQVVAIRGDKPQANDTRANLVSRTADALLAETDPAAMTKLAGALNELLAPSRKFKEQSEELAAFSGSPAATQVINAHRVMLTSIEQLPNVQKAQQKAMESLIKSVEFSKNTPVQEATLTPETQDRAQAITTLATQDPETLVEHVSPNEIKAVLGHSDLNTLTDAQKQALTGVLHYIGVEKALDDTKLKAVAEQQQGKPVDTKYLEDIRNRHLLRQEITKSEQVHGQATHEVGAINEKGQVKPSARQFFFRVIKAMNAGNTSVAKEQAIQLANLAQSHVNKLAALEESRKLGLAAGEGKVVKVDYLQWIAERQAFEWASTNPISTHKEAFVIPDNVKSEAHVQTVKAEADLLSRTVAGLEKAYPELSVKAPTLPKVGKVVTETKKLEPKAKLAPTPAPKAKPAATPAPVTKPVTVKQIAKQVDQAIERRIAEGVAQPKPVEKTPAPAPVKKAQAPVVKAAVPQQIKPSAEPSKVIDPTKPTSEAKIEMQEALAEKPVLPSKKADKLTPFTFTANIAKFLKTENGILSKLFSKLSPEKQLRETLLDSISGLLSRTGAELTPFNPAKPFLAIFTLEGKKSINDLLSHEYMDGVLRIMAREVMKGTDVGMKIGSDVQGTFATMADAQKVQEAMQKAIGPGFQVRVAGTERQVNQTFQEALDASYKLADADIKQLRAKSQFSQRKAPPRFFLEQVPDSELMELEGINWNYDELKPEGRSPSEIQDWLKANVGPLIKKYADADGRQFAKQVGMPTVKIHPTAKAEAEKFSENEKLSLAYRYQLTGLVDKRGFLALLKERGWNDRTSKNIASLDMRALNAIDLRFGKLQADRVLQIFGQLLIEHSNGGAIVGHLHGDEFAVAMQNEADLRQFIADAKELLNTVELYDVKEDGTVVTQTGISFAEGFGTSLEEADLDINNNKKANDEVFKPTVTSGSQAAPTLATAQARTWGVGRETGRAAIDLGSSEVGLRTLQDAQPSVQEDSGSSQVAPKSTSADLWPNLIRGTQNLFHKFLVKLSPKGEPSTRLLGQDDSLKFIQDAVLSPDAAREFKGEALKQTLSPEISKAYQTLLSGTDKQSLRTVLNALDANLQAFLGTKFDGKPIREHILEGGSEAFNEWMKGKALNLTEIVGPKGSERIQYNPELLTQASLAAIQWLLTASQRQIVQKDEEDVEKEYGFKLPDGIHLNSTLAGELNQGSGLAQTKRTLSSAIRRFWGVKSDPNVGLGHSDAISEAMAGELLRSLKDAGLLTSETFALKKFQPDLPEKIGNKETERFIVTELGTKENPSPLYTYPELLEELVVTEPELTVFYGKDEVLVKPNQLGNPEVDTTEKSKTARGNMQEEQYFPNLPLAEALIALPEPEFIEAFGTPLPANAEKLYNKNDLRAIEGKNRSLTGGRRELIKVMKQMKSRAETDKVPLAELGKKYQYAVNNVNRIMMLGAFNPQSDKSMRETLMSTWSTMDLSDKSGIQYQYMMLALSQALGQKVHQKTFDQNIAWAQTALNGGGIEIVDGKEKKIPNLAPVVDELASWLGSGKNLPFRQAKAALGDKFSQLAMMSLIEMARHKNASPSELKAFRTPMYFEADGMTNGPFNSIGLLSVGQFTPEQIENMGRGGMSFGDTPVTADKLFAKLKDMYTATVNATGKEIANLRESLNSIGKTEATGQMTHLYKALSILLPGEVEYTEKGVELQRSFGKNPMTVLIYGSGIKGVAGKITSKLIEAFYEKLSLVAQANIPEDQRNDQTIAQAMFKDLEPAKALAQYQTLMEHMNALRQFQVGRSWNKETKAQDEGPESYYYAKSKQLEVEKGDKQGEINNWAARVDLQTRLKSPGSEQTFTFNQQEFMALQRNIQSLLVSPMYEGIKQTLGPSVFESRDQIIQVTKIQSLVAQKLFFQGVLNKLAEKKKALLPTIKETPAVLRKAKAIARDMLKANPKLDPKAVQTEALEAAKATVASGQVNSEFLSKKELRDVFDGLGDALPIFEADGQKLLLAKTARGSLFQELADMVIQYSRSLDDSKKTPPDIMVMDDVGVSAIPYIVIAMGDGRMVRHLYTKPFENTVEVFDGINIPAGKIGEHGARINEAAAHAFQGDVFKTLSAMFNKAIASDQVQKLLADPEFATTLQSSLKLPKGVDLATYIKGLQDDLVNRSYEQEARNTAINEVQHSTDQMAGTYQPFQSVGTSLEVSDVFNKDKISEKLNDKYHKALAAIKAREAPVEANPLQSLLAGLPVIAHPGGAQILKSDGIYKLISRIRERATLNSNEKALLRELALKGSFKSVTQIVAGTPAQVSKLCADSGLAAPDASNRGFYNPDQNTIYIMDSSLETILHELVHASTFALVDAYYKGDHKNLDELQLGTIDRLENLMKVFLAQGFKNITPEQTRALDSARRTINEHLKAGNQAYALDEFMSWALTNRELEALLGQTVVADDTALGRLSIMSKKVWNAIKLLVWGKATGRNFDTNLLAHIRFNTSILIKTSPSVNSILTESKANRSTGLALSGKDETRLDQLDQTFSDHIAANLSKNYDEDWDDVVSSGGDLDTTQARVLSLNVLKEAQAAFPDMSDRAKFTFQRMVMAFSTEAQIDPQAMTKVQELYAQVMKTLAPSDFPGDPQQAKRKFEFLAGYATGHLADARQRSPILPTFLAMAAVDENFRKVLETKALKPAEMQVLTGLDSAVDNLGTKLMEKLGNRLAGIKGQPANVRAALDQLIDGVNKNALDERKSLVDTLEDRELTMGRMINDGLVGVMKRGGLAAFQKGDKLLQSNLQVVRGLGVSLQALSFIANEQSAAVISEGIIKAMDKSPNTWAFARDLAGDLLGRVSSQGVIYDMLKHVRNHVTQARQMFREHVPFIINSQFKTKPTENQWDALHRLMGRYDLASLYEGRDSVEILQLVADQKALQSEIAYTEAFLRSEQPLAMKDYSRKIDQFVKFTQTGIRGGNLLTNAWAIAELLGEKNRVSEPNEQTVIAIDQLITLKLLAGASEQDRKTFSDLFTNERGGIEFTLNYLKGQRVDELKKATVGLAKYNHVKGSISSINKQGHLTVVEDSPENHRNMAQQGYVRVGSYTGSNIDPELGVSRSYYFAPDGRAQSVFTQGVAQTAYGTAFGVQTMTGMPLEANAGVIYDPETVAKIAKRLAQEQASSENLAPVYDEFGEIKAFIRMLSPDQTAVLKQPQDLAEALGRWRGRQAEEEWASRINDELVEKLHTMYEQDKDQTRYVDIFDPVERQKDKVLDDAVRLLPFAMRDTAGNTFGTAALGKYTDAVRPKLFVRRNLLTTTIGYRQASVGDLWTGTSRWSEKDRDLAKNILRTFFGEKAYRRLIWAERNWQSVMFSARTNIVVRSLVVPAANFVSGLYQLRGRGVSLVAIAKGVPTKLQEINTYINLMTERVRLEAELRANEENPEKTRILQSELKALLDSQKNLSIWPLVEAGEFSSITDVGDAIDNSEDTQKTVIDKLVEAVDKMPSGLRNAARQGYMARDTSVFKALQKATQYSDFVMKSIYYDHLLKNESALLESTPGFEEARHDFLAAGSNVTQFVAERKAREAMARARVTEEFINYDLPTGRGRGYLENMGLIWFMNFKLRAAKIGLSMIRNNPFQALMMTATPSLFGADTPINGNIFSKLFQGILGYSVSPAMALQPIALNPWYNLIAD